MFSPPADPSEPMLRAVLEDGWSLRAATCEYRPIGFGSHHWEITGTTGGRWFVTVDDLRTHHGLDVIDRLRAALSAATALEAAGREFVVAPRPARDGEPVARLGDAFAVAVYPFVAGQEFAEDDYRRAILDLIVAVHAAPAPIRDLARRDDYAIRFREALTAGTENLGPYARPAADLLTAHAPALRRALARYDDLIPADGEGLVLTHGEPHPGNVLRTGDRWLLVDWDTALAAPPERDLWDLDPSLYTGYTAATGFAPRPELLELYRLRWHLTEIGACAARFRQPHGSTADDEETWANLSESIAIVTNTVRPL
jgi:aminoglycoside phosphotransferase (APT) family kinase protein